MSSVFDIRAAIAAELETAALSLPFIVEEGYIPHHAPEELEDLTVVVIPKRVDEQLTSRNSTMDDCFIDVAVQVKVASDTPAELDPYAALAHEIRLYFAAAARRKQAGATWVKSSHPFIYAPEHLREKRIFTSVVTLQYKVGK